MRALPRFVLVRQVRVFVAWGRGMCNPQTWSLFNTLYQPNHKVGRFRFGVGPLNSEEHSQTPSASKPSASVNQ